MRRFGNDFHSWLRHSWKSLPNRLTRDKKSLFTVTHALFFMYSPLPGSPYWLVDYNGKQPNNNAETLNSWNHVIFIYTNEEHVEEWMQNFADFKWLCHEWFQRDRTATQSENSVQSFAVWTVSQSHSLVTYAEKPARENSPQTIGELSSVMDS